MDPNYSFTCGIAFDFYNPVLCATSACKRRGSYTLFIFVYDGGSYTRTLPILHFIIHTDLFKVAVFPGFSFAALLAAVTIFVERKFLAKMQLRIGPLYCGKIEGILQLARRRLETNRQRDHYSVRS